MDKIVTTLPCIYRLKFFCFYNQMVNSELLEYSQYTQVLCKVYDITD